MDMKLALSSPHLTQEQVSVINSTTAKHMTLPPALRNKPLWNEDSRVAHWLFDRLLPFLGTGKIKYECRDIDGQLIYCVSICVPGCVRHIYMTPVFAYYRGMTCLYMTQTQKLPASSYIAIDDEPFGKVQIPRWALPPLIGVLARICSDNERLVREATQEIRATVLAIANGDDPSTVKTEKPTLH